MSEHTQGIIFNIQKFSIHDGPGIRTTVFMKGCPLRCRWCSNPESQQPLPQRMNGQWDSRAYATEEVLAVCLQDEAFYAESGGGVTISGGEPFVQMDFVTGLLARLHAAGIHTAVETTGCIAPSQFAQATKDVDLLLFDVKHHNSEKHREGTGMGNEAILENLTRSIASGKHVLPRIPIIPGFNDAAEDAKAFSALLRQAGAHSVQLLPFHQLGDRKYTLLGVPYAMQNVPPLHPEDLEATQKAFEACGIHAFL